MSLQVYSEDEILNHIRSENPWWINGKISEHLASNKRRLYFDSFINQISDKKSLLLKGSRGVGKSVLLFQTIEYLLESEHDSLKIAFLSLNSPVYYQYSLSQLVDFCKKATKQEEETDWFIIFDEIQHLPDWDLQFNKLVKESGESVFIASCSAEPTSVEIDEYEYTSFLLPPVTYYEYLHLKGLNRLITETKSEHQDGAIKLISTNNINELNKHFLEYINFGGFTNFVFSDENHGPFTTETKNQILNKLLLTDLPGVFGIREFKDLHSLFAILAYNSGIEVSLEELSKFSGLQKNTIKRYLEYFESAFLIKTVHKITNKSEHFQRATQFKVFLTNPSLRNLLFSEIQATDSQIENLVETVVYNQWLHRELFNPYYASWQKGQVSMVKLDEFESQPQWAIEIKWNNLNFDKPENLKALKQFINDNEMNSALVTTLDKEGIKELDGFSLIFMPAAVYAYTIGKSTFQ